MTRQRVAAAVGAGAASPARGRRSASAMTPVFSADSTRRRDWVRVRRRSSPTTAPRPGWRSASSIAASTATSVSSQACSTRAGARPAAARPGANRSGVVAHQRTGALSRASRPATNRVVGAMSAASPANSCSAPRRSPPSGKCASRAGTPNGSAAAAWEAGRWRARSRSRRVARGLMFVFCSVIWKASSAKRRDA